MQRERGREDLEACLDVELASGAELVLDVGPF